MRLREARVRRGLDLAEIETATKIQARFLRAIENEEWDALPGEFYARSFIRSYAAHLGLADAGVPEQLGAAAASDAAERSPRIDPAPPQRARARSRRRTRPSPRRLVGLAVVGLAAVLVAVGLSNLGGDSIGPSRAQHPPGAARGGTPPNLADQPPEQGRGASLTLTATAEVWVCLLDQWGRALIDGQILDPGSEQGPYRSGGFTVGLGNGSVKMSVGGRTAPIPPIPNPIGFAIDRHGTMRQLSAAERPTCA